MYAAGAEPQQFPPQDRLVHLDMDSIVGDLQLFLHYLWTSAFRRIAHDLALVDGRLTSTGVCVAAGRLAATFDEDMSLQGILAREALLAMATWEWLNS